MMDSEPLASGQLAALLVEFMDAGVRPWVVMEIGELFRTLPGTIAVAIVGRGVRGMSEVEIAADLDVDQATVSRWISWARHHSGLYTLLLTAAENNFGDVHKTEKPVRHF